MAALNAVHPDRDQKIGLSLALNTFCRCEHFKLMRNRDQRLSQHLIVGVLVNVSGKVAIDLYQIKEEILKMAKRSQESAEPHETQNWPIHCPAPVAKQHHQGSAPRR